MEKYYPSHCAMGAKIIFPIGDCEKTVKEAQLLGDTVLIPPTYTESFGFYALVQDPQGACFGIRTPLSKNS